MRRILVSGLSRLEDQWHQKSLAQENGRRPGAWGFRKRAEEEAVGRGRFGHRPRRGQASTLKASPSPALDIFSLSAPSAARTHPRSRFPGGKRVRAWLKIPDGLDAPACCFQTH